MSRVMAIDYGTQRTGIAWSDPLGISVTPLGTFPTSEIKEKLKLSKMIIIYQILLDYFIQNKFI